PRRRLSLPRQLLSRPRRRRRAPSLRLNHQRSRRSSRWLKTAVDCPLWVSNDAQGSAGAVTVSIVIASLWLGGCAAAAPSRFTTQLDRTGGIGPGDPVTHANAPIGRVTGVAPISGGDSEIEFEV